MRQDESNERPPVESQVIDQRDIEPEGENHRDGDERSQPEQRMDPFGEDGPSYERDQAVQGREVHPGGSSDLGDTRSHADSGDQTPGPDLAGSGEAQRDPS